MTTEETKRLLDAGLLAIPVGAVGAFIPDELTEDDFQLLVATLQLWKGKLVGAPREKGMPDRIEECLQNVVFDAPVAAPVAVAGPYSKEHLARCEKLVAPIRKAVANVFGVSESEIAGARRTESIVIPRHIFFYLALEAAQNASLVGKVLSRDHATIIHGHTQTKDKMQSNKWLADKVAEVKKKLANPDVKSDNCMSQEAVVLGRTFNGHHFTKTDLEARLDNPSLAGAWITTWLNCGWVENPSFGVFKLTKDFGVSYG